MNNSKPQPVLVFGAVTTFLTVVFGGLTLVAGLQDNPTVALVAGVGTLITGGLNQAKDFYVRGQVVPAVDTAAYRNDQGEIVAGPAAAQPNETPVEVVPTEAVVTEVYNTGAPVDGQVGGY